VPTMVSRLLVEVRFCLQPLSVSHVDRDLASGNGSWHRERPSRDSSHIESRRGGCGMCRTTWRQAGERRDPARKAWPIMPL